MQNAVQKGVPQPPIYQGHPPLQQAEGPMVEQQVAPSEKPPTTEVPPFSEVLSGSSINLVNENRFAEHI
jgi:hypothetical protein